MSGQDIRSLYQEELIQVVREMGGWDFQGKQLLGGCIRNRWGAIRR